MNFEVIKFKMENLLKDQLELGERELILRALNIDENTYDKILECKNSESKNICSAFLKDIYYQCYDCSDTIYHAYCSDCFVPEKHQGHVVIYCLAIGGCCDCGDIDIMKEESCCQKHQQKKIISFPQIDGKNELNILDEITFKYRTFIQFSFALLFNKIEAIIDCPPKFDQNFERAQTILQLKEIESQKEQLLLYLQTKKEILLIYQRITQIIKIITDENVPYSILTSQLLSEAIQKDLQQIFSLRHKHSSKIQITAQTQNCPCSILELFVKYYSFLQNDDLIAKVFYNVQVEQNFNPLISTFILKHYSNLYLPRQKYKFITQDNRTFKFVINKINYSEDSTILNLFQTIQNLKYKEIIRVNYLEKNQIQSYFLIILRAMINQIQKNINQPDSNFFQQFQQIVKELPLWTNNSKNIIDELSTTIKYFYSIPVNKQIYFQQIQDISKEDYINFTNSLIDSNSETFNHLQNNCLLILLLTSLFSSSLQDIGEIQLEPLKIKKYYQNSMSIQFYTLQLFRSCFSQIIGIWKDLYQSNLYVLQNLLRISIAYYLKTPVCVFDLEGNIAIYDFLKNQILSDRNFITLLVVYLSFFNDSSQAYKSLLNLCDNNLEQLKISMLFLLKRTILSYVTFHFYEENQYYQNTQDSLEQTDLVFFQIYAFIFQEQGINDIIQEYKKISKFLRQSHDVKNIICKICQSDFEYIQCLACYSVNDISNQIQIGIRKLFSTIFFAQNYYATKDLLKLLRTLNFSQSYNIQQIILTSCELNPENDSLSLKQELQPAHYEPILAEMVKSIQDIIKDKLKTQNDSFTDLFGNAITHELTQLNIPGCSITSVRKNILKAIVTDKNQILLQDILLTLQQYQEIDDLNRIKDHLQQNAIYLNLIFQANKYISQNETICSYLSSLKEIIIQVRSKFQHQVFDNYILLLDEKSTQNEQISQSEQLQKQQNIKKQQLLQRFNKMSQAFQEQSQNQLQQENICSKCQSPIEQHEVQYKPVLLEFTNQHKYYCQTKVQKDTTLDLLQLNTTCCGHLYHQKCLKQIRSKHKKGQKIYQCCICFASFNFYFMSPNAIHNIDNSEFDHNIQFFFNLIGKDKSQYYYQKYSNNNKLQLSLVTTEIFSCSLYSLLLQLLSDIRQFYERKNHLFLQEILMLLKLAYSENFLNIFDLYQFEQQTSPLYQLFQVLINNTSFKYSENEFQIELSNTLQNLQNSWPIIELINQSELKSQLSQDIYDIKQFKQQLICKFQEDFGKDFKEFLLKYNLKPCGKKKCRYLPKYQNGQQCICLICFKKMCAKHCGTVQSNGLGNLSRHSIKNHLNKALFVNIKNSSIFVMQAPLVVYHQQALFQNLIGESANIGNFKSDYYKAFKLNFKVVEWIVDVIVGQKYLNKIFADTSQIQNSIW